MAAALDADALRTGAPRPCNRMPFHPSGRPGTERPIDGGMGAPTGMGPWAASRPAGLGPMEYPRPFGHFPPQPAVNAGGFVRGKGKGKGKGKALAGGKDGCGGSAGRFRAGPAAVAGMAADMAPCPSIANLPPGLQQVLVGAAPATPLIPLREEPLPKLLHRCSAVFNCAWILLRDLTPRSMQCA